jgi:hypothetical protein
MGYDFTHSERVIRKRIVKEVTVGEIGKLWINLLPLKVLANASYKYYGTSINSCKSVMHS